ncbi:hypothetical protein [Bdellovibrio sp. HCB2-146]|uniref:hypothetical protein n=1 Tax=Bdellovibrio sp. HCB2-146 TaxID=3394362 RepID=UPI0039BD358F
MKLISATLVCSLFWSHAGAQTPSATVAPTPSPSPVEVKADTPEKKHPDFQTPLFFAVMDKELKIKNPQVDYDLQKSKGQSLNLGGLVFDADSLTVRLENNSLKFNWNAELVPGGDITVINQQGKELWKHKAEGQGTWAFDDLKSPKAPQWKDGEKFRFCLRSEVERGFSSLCTSWYAIEIKDTGTVLGPTKSEATARVILQNEERKLKGVVDVAAGAPVQFLATLTNNATYEFVSEPVVPVIKDMIESAKKEKHVTLTGELPRPYKLEASVIPGNVDGKITKVLGFEKTIGVARDLWQADLALAEPRLILPGKSGGVFSYALEIKNPPRQKDRRYISDKALTGTYLAKDQMPVKDAEDNLQKWEFETPQKFSLNTVYLDVQAENETHRSYLEVYRGGAGEASLRLTGVVTSNSDFVMIGEAHVSYWFNDLFGWQNYYLSKQRWGMSARYLTSLSQLSAEDQNGASSDVDLKVAEADIRYRLTPGLWEKDETVGLIMAYEALTLGDSNVPKLGVGLFWARSMPRALDSLFNKLPFMNYPKWVDMEFIKYVSSTDSDMKIGDDYVLNFHGKVMWTPKFFGEAGFGLKSYFFESKTDGSGAKLSTFYGTLGLGWNF